MLTQFNFIKAWLTAQTRTERGASLVEYALLVALIAVVCITAIGLLSGGIKKSFSDAGSAVSGV